MERKERSEMTRYYVRLRYIADDWAIVDASDKEQAVSRAYDAVSAPNNEPWIIRVGSDIVKHQNPVVRLVEGETQ
jgi:hypothetical protein